MNTAYHYTTWDNWRRVQREMNEDRVVAIATATFWVALMLSAAVMKAV